MKKILLLILSISLNCYFANSQISNDGLIAYYPFNGDVLDHSSNDFDGISHGGSYVNDQYGNFSALELNGLNEFVDLSLFATAFSANMKEMTIVFDILFEKEEGDQTILSLGKVGDDLGSNVFEIEYEHNRLQVETETGNEATNHEFPIDDTQFIFDQKWHRMAITLKDKILTYCRDGKIIYKGEYIPAETNTENFYLGQFSGGTSAWNYALGATIDELQFYNRVLSDDEICSSSIEQNCEGEYVVNLDEKLLLHYDLDNNAIDHSGNDFNGTMIDISGVEDRFGTEKGAIYFDESSNFIFPENDELQPQFPISISVWAYFEKEEKFTNAIVNTNFVENNYHGIFLYRIFEDSNISISYGGGLGITAPENRRTASTKKAVPIQEWVHIVGIISGPEEFEIYINGCNQVLNYSGYGPTVIAYNEHPGQLGLHDSNMLPEYPNHTLVGALDDFYFWNRTISEEEILYLYDGFYTKAIDVDEEYIILDQEPVQITLDANYTDVVWSNGEMGNDISISEAGSYSVEAYHNCILVCKSFVVREIDFEQNCEGDYDVNLEDKLLLHYAFNENANDNSANEFHGEMENITRTKDRFGVTNGAVHFSENSKITLPLNDQLKPDYPLSFSFWCYFDFGQGWYPIIETNFVENSYYGMAITFNGGGYINIIAGQGGNTGPDDRISTTTVDPVNFSEWNHVAVILNSPGDFHVFYNGCESETFHVSGTGTYEMKYSDVPGVMGLYDNTIAKPPYRLVGELDDFYFWDRTISEEEVLYLYDGFYTKPIDMDDEYIILDQVPVQITLDTNYTDVVWSNGEMGNEISISEEGSYSVEAYDDCILVCKSFVVREMDFEQNCEGAYEVDLDENLLLHYELNNNAIDQSGNDFNGTMIDVSGVEDRFGTENGAIYFNGTSNFIFPENDELQPQFPISISVWAYFEKEEQYTHAIVSTNFVENNYHGIMMTRSFETGNIGITYGGGLGNTGPDNRRSAISKIGVPIQEWVHLVGIISGPEEFKIYINGCHQELTYSGYGPTEIAYNEHPGQLGLHDSNTLPGYPNYRLVGALDDFYFWDRTISEEEVLYLYDGFYTKAIDMDDEYIILDGNAIEITLDTNYTDVVWSNGEMGNEILISEEGSYSVEAYDDCILVCKSFVVSEIDFEQNCEGEYEVDLDENLLLHYEFNNNAIDYSGNEFHGEMKNIIGTEDRFGNSNGAIHFDGNSSVMLPEENILEQDYPMSFSIWAYFDEDCGGFCPIISTNYVENDYQGLNILRHYSGRITIVVGNGQGHNGFSNYRAVSSIGIVELESWNHIVVILETLEKTRIFINGCEYELTSFSGEGTSEIAYSDQSGQLGLYDNSTFTDPFTLKGSLDDLYFWNRVITEDEVLYLYDRFYTKEMDLEDEYIITDGNAIGITLDTNYTDVVWSNGEMGNEILISEEGSYSVEAYDNCILVCADFEVKEDLQDEECEIVVPINTGCNKNRYECVLSDVNGGIKYIYEGHFQIPDGYELCGSISSSISFNHGEIEIVDSEMHVHYDGSEWISYTSFINIDDMDIFKIEDSYISFKLCSINSSNQDKCISYFLPYKSCDNSYECIVQNHGVSANNTEYIDVNYCLNLHEVVQNDCSVEYFEIEAVIYGDENYTTVYNETLYGDFSMTRCIKIPILINDFLSGAYNCVELFINADCPNISCAHLDCNVFYKSSYKSIVENESITVENIALVSSFENQNKSTIENINISPNPTVDELNINFEANNNGNKYRIILRNLLNQKCLEKSFIGDNVRLNISELNVGIYYLSIINNGIILTTKKIIKVE